MFRSSLAVAIALLLHSLPSMADPLAGIDPAGMDPSVRAQDDLYLAANGRWLAATSIPPSRVEVHGAELPEIVGQRVHAILDDAAAHPRDPVGTFYASLVDEAAIERRGFAPVRALHAGIERLRDARSLATWEGSAQGRLQTPLWLWGGFADLQDPTLSRMLGWQGGLGLPDRDLYLARDDARAIRLREAYRAYLTTLARLAGLPRPEVVARHVLALETHIAEVEVPAADANDPARMVNPLNAAELAARAPGLDWDAFLRAAGLDPQDRINVAQLPAAVGIARLHADLPLQDWKWYLELHSLDADAVVLPRAFRTAHFDFHGTALDGLTAAPPRWRDAVQEVRTRLPDAIAKRYVERHFDADARAHVEAMVTRLVAAAKVTVAGATWMSDAARAEAAAKLDRLGAKIGYPAVWPDEAALAFDRGDAVGNRARAQRQAWLRLAAAAARPIDRARWQMSPLETDAFYDPMLNEITLPAAHLQSPWFDPQADDAANYGGLGALIAHEISHGFDPQGAQFDARGAMHAWWQPADQAGFEQRSARLAAQVGAFEARPGATIDARLTLPEDVADVAGLQIAWLAYQQSLQGRPAPVVDGLSGAQRFFIAYAQTWRVKQRDEFASELLKTDPHAPAHWRADGPARNLDAFHDAFHTRPGDGMYLAPADRVRLW